MRQDLLDIIEQMAASEDFDEAKFDKFYDLLNALEGDRGLLGVAADQVTEYYACWRQSNKHIAPNDPEAVEIRENLRLLAAGLRRNITKFKSFKHLRKELEREDLRADGPSLNP